MSNLFFSSPFSPSNECMMGWRETNGEKECVYQISPEARPHHLHSHRYGDESCLCSFSMILSDCSLSFSLPGTQMRSCIKDPLNLRLLCHVLLLFSFVVVLFFCSVFSAVPFYEITQRLWFSLCVIAKKKKKQSVQTHTWDCYIQTRCLMHT